VPRFQISPEQQIILTDFTQPLQEGCALTPYSQANLSILFI
jgi:hypothetical protein